MKPDNPNARNPVYIGDFFNSMQVYIIPTPQVKLRLMLTVSLVRRGIFNRALFMPFMTTVRIHAGKPGVQETAFCRARFDGIIFVISLTRSRR